MTVCSKAFLALGRAQSAAMGERGMPIVEIPHPFGSRAREELRDIAQSCAEQIHAWLEQAPKS